MRYSVDRMEGETIVLLGDQGDKILLNRDELPSSLKEGDLLCHENGEWVFDTDETEQRRKEARALLNGLFE